MHRLAAATADLDPPFAVVDLDAFDRNADALVARAGGKPIRVATKSIRCRALTERVLGRPGFAGVLAATLPEALWLVGSGTVEDAVLGYPTVHRGGLRRLAADERALAAVTLMVDSAEQLDLVDAVLEGPPAAPIRVCLDLDASLRLAGGRVHLGPRRSPVHDPAALRALAAAVARRPSYRLVGVMAYEGLIAGVPDDADPLPRRLAVRAVQRWSAAELLERRGAAVAAVREVADLEFVNGGGTGSLELTSADPAVTELAAGSGLLAPTLFDGYRRFTPEPAACFALPVVRRPAPDCVTVLGGGWVASGPAGRDRLPAPVWPQGLALVGEEGAGEVQTPLRGTGARDLRIGDRVWFRHAKAGELCEHVDTLHLVGEGGAIEVVRTYRGEQHELV